MQKEGSDIRMRMLLDQPCFQGVDESSTESEAVMMGTGQNTNEVFILLLADGAIGVWLSLPVEHYSSCCSVATYPFSDKALSGRFATAASSPK